MFRAGFVVALCASPVLAQEEGIASCHAVADNAARLACYDTASGYAAPSGETTAASPSASPPVPISAWQVTEERSQLEDRTDVWLSVVSENTQPNQIGQPEVAGLYIRCMDNSTNVFVTFNDYTSYDQTVKYRTDEDELQSIWMQTMNGGQGIGIWSGAKAIPFIKSLYGKQKLVLAYDSYSNYNLEFVFPINGLEEKVSAVAEACGWT